MPRIPVAAPDLTGKEEEYCVNAIRSSWISSTGAYIDCFERDFAKATGAQSAIGVCNGTVALHLALLALDVRPGDEVIVPSLTFIATANAVRYVGAEPVFVDVDPESWCLDPERIEAAVTTRTRGIIAVHLYGHPAEMDAINHLAAIHGFWVIEDAAEAHFASYRGRPVGSLARIGTFSFFGNKIITCGEGGALTVSDPQLEKRIRTLRGQGVDPGRRYYFPVTGYNFRLTNLSCALLCAQLERKEEIVTKRHRVFARYQEQLWSIPGIGFQPRKNDVEIAPWLFGITVDEKAFGRTRDELMTILAEQGIETRPFFIPLHSLPPYREESRRRGEMLPHTERLGATGVSLPTYTQLSALNQDIVCDAIRGAKR